MKILCYLCALAFPYVMCAQSPQVRPQIQKIANDIATANYIAGEVGGLGSLEKPEQFKLYEKLAKRATSQELLALIEHKNAVVRCYAFDALRNRKGVDIVPIIKKLMMDTARVTSQLGCFVDEETVSARVSGSLSGGGSKLTPLQNMLGEIDSLYLFTPDIPENAVIPVLYRIKPEENYYSRIRELCIEDTVMPAMPLLAKYRKQADKQLIISWLNSDDENMATYGLLAVKEFPDKDFYPSVKKIHSAQINNFEQANYFLSGSLYDALVQYKTVETRQLIEQTLKSKNEKMLKVHAESIAQALYHNQDAVFSGLMEKISLDESQRQRLHLFSTGKPE